MELENKQRWSVVVLAHVVEAMSHLVKRCSLDDVPRSCYPCLPSLLLLLPAAAD